MSVRIYKIDNGTGSARLESCEISHNLLMTVSEFDKEPNLNLFEVERFYNLKFIKWTDIKEYQREFTIDYGIYDHKRP